MWMNVAFSFWTNRSFSKLVTLRCQSTILFYKSKNYLQWTDNLGIHLLCRNWMHEAIPNYAYLTQYGKKNELWSNHSFLNIVYLYVTNLIPMRRSFLYLSLCHMSTSGCLFVLCLINRLFDNLKISFL